MYHVLSHIAHAMPSHACSFIHPLYHTFSHHIPLFSLANTWMTLVTLVEKTPSLLALREDTEKLFPDTGLVKYTQISTIHVMCVRVCVCVCLL